MSLVPILYTSLLLFGILAVVIITISYISYKIRNRNSEEEERYQKNYVRYSHASVNHKRYIQQPQQSNNVRSTIKVVPTIKRPELRKTSELPYGKQRTTVINNFSSDDRSSTRRKTYNEHYNKSNYPETKDYSSEYRSRTTSGSFKSRIEIINKIQPEESPKEKFVVSGSGSIALPKYYENFKAIQYYSDEEEEYLYKPSRHYR